MREKLRHGAAADLGLWKGRALALIVGLGALAAPASGWAAYVQNNLVSDLPGFAPVTDPNLVNPWGLASSATSPIWVSDNRTGVSTLYNGAGKPFPVGNPLVVTIPPPDGSAPPAAPTGVVFNSTAGFGGAPFIFATEDGTISAWSGGTAAVLKVDNSGSGAVYKGLALASNRIYASNFNSGGVDVFDSGFNPVTVPGGFIDPNIPAGFAPFGIANLGGKLFVTYAKQDAAKHDDVAGPGNGFVDVFDTDGNFCSGSRSRDAQLAMGPRPGAGQLRRIQRRPPDRQFRRWHDQCVQPHDRRLVGNAR